MDPQVHVGLLGATGYAGQVLHALLTQHECMQVATLSSRDPHELTPEDAAVLGSLDAVCLALPGEVSARWVPALLELAPRAKLLDLSDHYRRDDDVHYGQPELFGAPDPSARLVANPGCYPTATLLALQPLIAAGVIDDHGIAVVGASGATGAGKQTLPHLHFCHLEGNVFPYKVGQHRHIPEIERYLGAPISFVTELLPVSRGILITAFVRPNATGSNGPAQLLAALKAAHADHPYVTVLDAPGQACGLRHVVGTHQCVVAVGPVERSGLVPVFSTIDNLMKGAASQAVHNLNLWCGLDPHSGLPAPKSPAEASPSMSGLSTYA